MTTAHTLSTPSNPLKGVAQSLITVLTLPLLVILSVRLVMSPFFLQVEYTRADFPADPYGFTTEERLRYGNQSVAYLLNGEDIDFLGDLTFADGVSLFNERELRHMHDVKALTGLAFMIATGLGGIYFLALFYLYRDHKYTLRYALQNGGIVTIAGLVLIIVLALTSWEFFFVTFHELFFADGTWHFPYSDTLIRLFPEQFWFDAAITIGGLTVICAALMVIISRLINRQRS